MEFTHGSAPAPKWLLVCLVDEEHTDYNGDFLLCMPPVIFLGSSLYLPNNFEVLY